MSDQLLHRTTPATFLSCGVRTEGSKYRLYIHFSGRPRYYVGTYDESDYVDHLILEIKASKNLIDAVLCTPTPSNSPSMGGIADTHANNIDGILSACETAAQSRLTYQRRDQQLYESQTQERA